MRHSHATAQPAVAAPQHRSLMSRLTGPRTRRARPGEKVYVEPQSNLTQTHTHAHTHSHTLQHGAAPVHHQHRRVSIGDKISGAMLKLKGSLMRRPGVKAAGTRRMRGTDGRGSRRY